MSYTDKTLGWGTGKSTMIFALFTILSLSFFGGIGMTFVNKAFGLTSPQGMRWLQFSISMGLFFMPPLLFAQYASNDPSRFLGLVKLPNFQSAQHARKNAAPLPPLLHVYLSLALISFGAFFAIDALSQINQFIVPDTPYFENLKIQEKSVTDALEKLLSEMTLRALSANMIVMVLVPALGEELFFRGVLLKLFKRNFSLFGAVLLSAFCFAVAHQQPMSFLPLLAMGVLLALTKEWTGSLWAPIALHCINNGFALVSSYLSDGALQNESTMAIGWSLLGVLPLAFGLYWLQLVRKKHLAWLK